MSATKQEFPAGTEVIRTYTFTPRNGEPETHTSRGIVTDGYVKRAGPYKGQIEVMFIGAYYGPSSVDPAELTRVGDTSYLVTIKLPKNPDHNPHDKKSGPCAVSEHCTDVTGEHHTLLARSAAEVDATRAQYGHVTRVEQVR